MSIEGIIAAGKGTAGHGGSWRVETDTQGVSRLFHYAHLMLTWNASDPHDENVLDYSIGYGSVSDQGGMNKAFRILGLPLYFSRADFAILKRAS